MGCLSRVLGVWNLILVFLNFGCVQSKEIVTDDNKVISILSVGDKFEVLPGRNIFESVVAWANFTDDQGSNGWMYLEITTNQAFPDEVQAKAAGFAEGYLTRNTIHEYFKEFYVNDICNGEEGSKVCQYMKDQIMANDIWIRENIESSAQIDPFWHMVRLFYQQMEGMMDGWITKTLEQEGSVPEDFDTVYAIKLINYIADMFDFLEKYNPGVEDVLKKKVSKPTCSVLVKHLPGDGELYVAHNTWHEYRAMGYRFLKKYQLNYHVLPSSKELVPGHTATMSSYAGTILSLDDFMTLSSGLVTTETSLFVYDSSLFDATDPSSQVFEPVRVMVANRLARNGKEFTDLVSKYNSGTYNNQWMVIDYNRIGVDGSLGDGALWVLEQLPGKVWAADQTSILREKGYWASYNRAFYPEAFNMSGAQDLVDKHGSWFSYSETPRALIMARDQGGVVDEESMIKLMRYNSFQTDPLAKVPGCPTSIPAGSIANRCDLTPPDSKCVWEDLDYMVGHQPYGALDMKFVTRKLLESQQFYAVAGPTHGPNMPPFSWRDTNLTSIPTHKPIMIFDFQPIVHSWTLGAIHDAIKKIF